MSLSSIRELKWFVERCYQLQAVHPFSVTSWWRTVARNIEVGGLANSLHLEGLAVDCVLFPGRSGEEFLRDARILGLYGRVEKDHVHIQARARGVPRREDPSPPK